MYVTFTRIVLSIFHLVGYIDEKALYCTSRDRETSFEEGSPYCNIIGTTQFNKMVCSIHWYNFSGSAITFILSFDFFGLCFHMGTVLFTVYFPFRARGLETRGGYKYFHLVAVICAIGFSGVLVGLQFAVGGYSRTVIPVLCIAAPESSFVFGIVPVCLISAIFLTFVMILLFKIISIQGWRLNRSEVCMLYFRCLSYIEVCSKKDVGCKSCRIIISVPLSFRYSASIT